MDKLIPGKAAPGPIERASRSEQRENSGAPRVRGRPFPEGKSGNPGGRPKGSDHLRQLAQAHTAEALKHLAFWMRSTNAKASVGACNALLDRGWGKPVQAIIDKNDGPIDVNINEVRGAIARKLDRIADALAKEGVPQARAPQVALGGDAPAAEIGSVNSVIGPGRSHITTGSCRPS
jgi:hypothetical protein